MVLGNFVAVSRVFPGRKSGAVPAGDALEPVRGNGVE